MRDLQVNKKMFVPYNDPDAANSRLETLDDYVAFGAAAARTATRVASSSEKPGRARTRAKGFLGSLVMKKSEGEASVTEGLGLLDQSKLFGFEPEALNFVLTMVRCLAIHFFHF